MFTEVRIQNFKSIPDLKLNLGRVNVLIGENGCGKSNILEGIAFGAAAVANKLDHEFLASRGIRMTSRQHMFSAFAEGESESQQGITFEAVDDNQVNVKRYISSSDDTFGNWSTFYPDENDDDFTDSLINDLALKGVHIKKEIYKMFQQMLNYEKYIKLRNFLIFSPENTHLRTFQTESQINPIGIKGEGLFHFIKALNVPEYQDRLLEIKEQLRIIDWFDDLRVPTSLAPFEHTLQIKDRYLREDLSYFDQRSANEGFLFLLFYFALFIGEATPPFFAIDNLDASLNPKLCCELMRRLVVLAKKYDKQVLITTHNPAILDGLNLHDEEQRLLVVYRIGQGATRVRRVSPPQPVAGELPIKLSEAFLRGLLGGLPQNF